jgi:NADH-quinone oxidoreductase subunit M
LSHWPLLSLVTFLPLVGAAFILMARGDDAVVARNARNIALWTSLIDFALSLAPWFEFEPSTADFQFVERADWVTIGGFQFTYHMGIDGISLFFVLLSTLLTLLSILSAWEAIQFRVKEFMVAFLVLETLMVGIFCALDFVLFYVFFEGVLIPMFLIIGIWGGSNRIYSAFKVFLYTLLGSVLMLLAILAVYFQTGTTDIEVALPTIFPAGLQKWLWLAFFASFAVKVPMWPVHTWLPDAHVEAPTAARDPGGHSLEARRLRLCPFLVADVSARFRLFHTADLHAQRHCGDLTSLVALAQIDMKKLIAYSSIAHMGFVTMGTFAVTNEGCARRRHPDAEPWAGSRERYFCVGVLYDRLHTHEITRLAD